MGVSGKCVKTWIDCHAVGGDAGLQTRSSRPHTVPTTSDDLERQVLTARAEHREGPDVLGPRVGVPSRTVSRIWRRYQMPYLRDLDPISGELIRSSKQAAVRYQRDHPGELVHMDVKKLGKIPDGGGWRAHGRAQRETTRDRSVKTGYDYIHSLIDDHSRLAYSDVLPDEKGTTCAAFLDRAIDYFATHGITRIEQLITDNAWAYRHSLRAVCATHGIQQKFIKPHCPWQNSKAERLNRTLATEWAYRQAFTNNDTPTAALTPWIEHYNTEHSHSALGRQPPTSRLPPT